MRVKFMKNHTPYRAGETAVFDDRRANALVDQGIAVSAEMGPAPAGAPGYLTKPMLPAATAPTDPPPAAARRRGRSASPR